MHLVRILIPSLLALAIVGPPVRAEEPLRLELRAFLDACAGRAPNPVPASVGVRALDVVEAAERSARLARTVIL